MRRQGFTRRQGLTRQQGFTLMELMVTLAMLGIVTASVTGLLAQQGATYQVVDQVTESQQTMRAIADLMEREIRATGFMVDQAAAFCGSDSDTASDVMFVTDADPLSAGPALLGATITGGFSGTGTDALTVDSLVLDGNPFYDTDGNGVADSDFRKLAGVIVVDTLDASRGASCGVITSFPSSTSMNVSYAVGGATIGAGGTLVAIPAHVYQVNGQAQLERDGMVLADGVEDLQVALFYDTDGDDVVDANQDDPGSATYLAGQYESDKWDNDELREVRFNIVMRSRTPDPAWSQGQFQTTENRDPVAGTDGFRRRTFTASVRPRNVGARGGL